MKLHKAIVLSAGGVALIGGVLFAATTKDLKTDLDNAVQTIGSVTISTGGNSATLSGDSAGNLNIRTNNFIIKNGSISSSSGSSIFGGTGNQISNSKNSTIVAGENNTVSNSTNGFIGGGSGNRITGGSDNAIPGGNSNIINGSHSVIVGNKNSLSGAHNAIVGQNNTIQGGTYSVVMGSGATLSASNSFLWSSGNKEVNLNQNDVFAVMGKMAVNTGKVSGNAGLHIGAPLIVSTGENTNITCNSNLKGSLKLVKKYSSSDNSSFKNQMCLCSCNGSGWTSVENSKFCEKPCTQESPYVEETDNGLCGNGNGVEFDISRGVYSTGGACSGNYKLIEDSFLLSGKREDNMARLWWACQDDYGKTVSCSKTFSDYKCVKSTDNSYADFGDNLIPANADWNNNVLPNSPKQVKHSTKKSDICSFSCKDEYSWGTGDDNKYDCFKQCDDFDGNKVNHGESIIAYEDDKPICKKECKEVTLKCKNGDWYNGNNKVNNLKNSYKKTCQTQDGYVKTTYNYYDGYLTTISENPGDGACPTVWLENNQRSFSQELSYSSARNYFIVSKCTQYNPSIDYKSCVDGDTNYVYECAAGYAWNESGTDCEPLSCKQSYKWGKYDHDYELPQTQVNQTIEKLEAKYVENGVLCEADFMCGEGGTWSEAQNESCRCTETTESINNHSYELVNTAIGDTYATGTNDAPQCGATFKCTSEGWDGKENCNKPVCATVDNYGGVNTNIVWCTVGDKIGNVETYNNGGGYKWTCKLGTASETCYGKCTSGYEWKNGKCEPVKVCGTVIDYDGYPYNKTWCGTGWSKDGDTRAALMDQEYQWTCKNFQINETEDCWGFCTGNKIWDDTQKKCVPQSSECGGNPREWNNSWNGACNKGTRGTDWHDDNMNLNEFKYFCGSSECPGVCPQNLIRDSENHKCYNDPYCRAPKPQGNGVKTSTGKPTTTKDWTYTENFNASNACEWTCTGGSVKNGNACKCPSNKVWNSEKNICECPADKPIWDDTQKKCVATCTGDVPEDAVVRTGNIQNSTESKEWTEIANNNITNTGELLNHLRGLGKTCIYAFVIIPDSQGCYAGPIKYSGRTYILPKGEEGSTTGGIAWTGNKSNIKECYANFKCENSQWNLTAESCVSCATDPVTWGASLPTFCGSDSDLVGRSFGGTAGKTYFSYKCKSKNNFDLQMTCNGKCDANNNYHLTGNNPIVNGTNATLHNMACAKYEPKSKWLQCGQNPGECINGNVIHELGLTSKYYDEEYPFYEIVDDNLPYVNYRICSTGNVEIACAKCNDNLGFTGLNGGITTGYNFKFKRNDGSNSVVENSFVLTNGSYPIFFESYRGNADVIHGNDYSGICKETNKVNVKYVDIGCNHYIAKHHINNIATYNYDYYVKEIKDELGNQLDKNTTHFPLIKVNPGNIKYYDITWCKYKKGYDDRILKDSNKCRWTLDNQKYPFNTHSVGGDFYGHGFETSENGYRGNGANIVYRKYNVKTNKTLTNSGNIDLRNNGTTKKLSGSLSSLYGESIGYIPTREHNNRSHYMDIKIKPFVNKDRSSTIYTYNQPEGEYILDLGYENDDYDFVHPESLKTSFIDVSWPYKKIFFYGWNINKPGWGFGNSKFSPHFTGTIRLEGGYNTYLSIKSYSEYDYMDYLESGQTEYVKDLYRNNCCEFDYNADVYMCQENCALLIEHEKKDDPNDNFCRATGLFCDETDKYYSIKYDTYEYVRRNGNIETDLYIYRIPLQCEQIIKEV